MADIQPSPYVFRFGSWETGQHIKASIGGGLFHSFMIDTGSIGILVGSPYVGTNVIKTTSKFHFRYSSSGNTYRGYWAVAVVEFQADEHVYTPPQVRSDGPRERVGEQIPDHDEPAPVKVPARTYPMFLRVVESISRLNGHRPAEDLKVFMLGIGFDRNEVGDTPPPGIVSTPSLNPFGMMEGMYNDPEQPGITPGYVIKTDRIEVGLTTASSNGFNVIKLDLDQDQLNSGDWKAPMVNVSVVNASPPIKFSALLLLDTGLGYSIVQAPKDMDPPLNCKNDVKDGQEILISSLNPAGIMYDFVVHDHKDSRAKSATGNVIPPDRVSWRHKLHNGIPFINTSRYALSQVDYLVDLEAGRLGYRVKK